MALDKKKYKKSNNYIIQQQLTSTIHIAIIIVAVVVHHYKHKTRTGSSIGRQFFPRKRKQVDDVYKELGSIYFRRAYRMEYKNFQLLAQMLTPLIIKVSGKKQNSNKYAPNGIITPDVRLACALRWFAGGSAYDIMTTYGISHTETINSIWYVVDAVNHHASFNIEYPKDYNQQQLIAEGFYNVSSAHFNSCAGAIDGILIWIHKPSPDECISSGCDSGKYFCGRKKKFGLNCQAVCDVRGKFLDIAINYPGSTSDCLAFEGMSLFEKLERNILEKGLCLFGDNAYLNAPYMATPYAAVSGGTKDAYNFYHSQLRIRIECAFGIFTHRWSILRSAIPMNVSIRKTVSLVIALAKLHNYCIDTKDGNPPSNTPSDARRNELNGTIPLQPTQLSDSTNGLIPQQLLNGGHHFDDIGQRGRWTRLHRFENLELPRESMHSIIANAGLTRPLLNKL
jgi:DDE superfamily endonuclease